MGNVHGQASIKLNTIPANTSLLGGHFVYYQGDQNGTVASANVVEKVNNDPAKWGYNTHIGANGLHLRKGIDVKAALTTTGLKIMQGGIEAGAINTEDYIYVWSNDDNNHAIKIGNSSNNKNDWRIIAGNKFGVDKAGNLYANNADITGAITATSLTIANGASVSGVVVPSQIANMATQTDITNVNTAAQEYAANASYSVEIKVTAIDYSANTATLTAIPFYQGGVIPSGTTLTYTWYKDSVASENIVGSNNNVLNVTDTTNMGLDGIYICVISK